MYRGFKPGPTRRQAARTKPLQLQLHSWDRNPAKELIDRLQRFSRQYSWNFAVPELDAWQPDSINTGTSRLAPFTKRVAAICNHPAVRRLKSEPQLGWIKEIYT